MSTASIGTVSSVSSWASAISSPIRSHSSPRSSYIASPFLKSSRKGHRCTSEGLGFWNLSLSSDISVLKRSERGHGKVNTARNRSFVTFSVALNPLELKTTQLKGAKEAVKDLIKSTHCTPILIRLGWHDAGTYDNGISEWPKHGGANGSLRFKPESDHAVNAGLTIAIGLLEPIHERFLEVSYADLFQLASATAIEVAGGPHIPMKYGRVDARDYLDCSKEGNLPDAGPSNPAEHLRKVFYRMGFNDQEIVALSGAHTLGRSHPERSGWGKEETKYTKDGPGNPGGQSWTVDWLKFDNSYFKDIKARKDEDLLVLPTDAALFDDPNFKVYAEKYAEDEAAFFTDYAAAHKKLSELGAKFEPSEGISIIEGLPEISEARVDELNENIPRGGETSSFTNVDSKTIQIPLAMPRRKTQLSFTCNVCGVRSTRMVNPLALSRGTVFVQCEGCDKFHQIVDNLELIKEYNFKKEDELKRIQDMGVEE